MSEIERAQVIRDALNDGASPGMGHYIYHEAWAALDSLLNELQEAKRRIQALTDSLTYANDERGSLKRELAELQAYVHKQTEAWSRHD